MGNHGVATRLEYRQVGTHRGRSTTAGHEPSTVSHAPLCLALSIVTTRFVPDQDERKVARRCRFLDGF